jgi:hypothetical protein
MKGSRALLLVVAVLVVAVGCASAPTAAPLSPAKALQPGDLKMLAGEWEGTIRGAVGPGQFGGSAFPVRVTVGEDGKFTSNISGRPGEGTATIVDGKLSIAGSTANGIATLHERGGKPVLRGEGKLLGIDGTSQFEVTKR